jgi:hypothetical protein
MKSAYNETWLQNLLVVKECKRWLKAGVITPEQAGAIVSAHPIGFYHPNLIIRLLLFVAALIALSGVTGILSLMVADSGEYVIKYLVLLYGLGSFVFFGQFFIKNSKHYKSGVTEAILYHSILFTLGGLGWILEMKIFPFTVCCIIVFGFAAIRYLDLISTACAFGSLAYLVFYTFYESGETVQKIIPLAFLVLFTPFYFWIRRLRMQESYATWETVLLVTEALTLLVIYAAGNYMVVRELSIELMGLELTEGQDIPLAFIFYALTAIIPVIYLYAGIKKRDIVLIRVSLLVLAYTVFTFKYYFSTGHHEITFTVGGAIMLIVSVALMRFLKEPKNGFTRENLLPEKWGNANLQAFIVAQTLGGNKALPDESTTPGGGESGGGGSTDSF